MLLGEGNTPGPGADTRVQGETSMGGGDEARPPRGGEDTVARGEDDTVARVVVDAVARVGVDAVPLGGVDTVQRGGDEAKQREGEGATGTCGTPNNGLQSTQQTVQTYGAGANTHQNTIGDTVPKLEHYKSVCPVLFLVPP